MSSSKKYQIFVSSTYIDLKDERNKVFEAIYSIRHIPAGMEYFNAADDSSWKVIKSIIDESDFYVIIVAHSYGSEDSKGVSFTEKEYNYAKTKNIPILAFVRENIPRGKQKFVDSGAKKIKLDKFKTKILKKQCAFWNTKEELSKKVLAALNEAFLKHNQLGWIRGIDYVVKLAESVKEQHAMEIAHINTDKALAYSLLQGNINNLKEILSDSVYKSSGVPNNDDIKNIMIKFIDSNLVIEKDKLNSLFEPVFVRSYFSAAIKNTPAFESFADEYYDCYDNLKVVLALLKYKDNGIAKNVINMMSHHATLCRLKIELLTIRTTKLNKELLSVLNDEFENKVKTDKRNYLMHPVISFYTIMHSIVKDAISLENSLT